MSGIRPIQKRNLLQIVLNVPAGMILLGNWIFSVYVYPELPEKIPVHFDGAGEADRYGPKITYLVLPVLAAILFGVMTFIDRYPRLIEYAKSITGEGERSDFPAARHLMQVMKIAVMIVLVTIQVLTYTTVSGRTEGLGKWFLPFTLAIIFLPVAGFLIGTRLKK